MVQRAAWSDRLVMCIPTTSFHLCVHLICHSFVIRSWRVVHNDVQTECIIAVAEIGFCLMFVVIFACPCCAMLKQYHQTMG